MKKRNIIFWSVLLIFISLTLIIVNHRRKSVLCSNIDVVFFDSTKNKLLDKQEIIETMQDAEGILIGKEISKINLANLEDALNNQASVRHAEVYKTINGDIKVEIKQRIPILRIFTDSLSYYIDEYGIVMPLPNKYRPRVLPANGFIKQRSKMIADLYELAKFIYKNEFWKSQIQQIFVEKDGDIILIPRVGSQHIILGSINNLEKKFMKLMALYEYGFKIKDWNQYTDINLKYKNQVVCVRNL